MAKKRRYRKKRLKVSSWKRLRNRFQLRRKFRLLGLALLVVLATLVTFFSLYLSRFVKQPFVRAGDGELSSISWSEESPANFAWLVISSESPRRLEEIAVFHLNPDKAQALLIRLRPETIAGSDLGVTDWLSNLSKKLALPIRGYFLVDSDGLLELEKLLGTGVGWTNWGFQTLSRAPSLFPVLRRHLVTNFSLGGIFRVLRFVLSLRSDQKVEIDFKRIEGDVSSFCSDGKIVDEGTKILVLNGTLEPGLAVRASKWIENLGGIVLDVGNAPQQNYEYSVILASDPLSYTAGRLASDFGISNLRGIGESLEWAKRADVVLILGLDKKDFF